MNRNSFNPWAVELSAGDFACALAALGVLQDGPGGEDAAAADAKDLSARLSQIGASTRGALRWAQTIPARDFAPPPGALVEAWRTFRASRSGPLRLEVGGWREPLDPLWILGQLSHPEVGAEALYLAKERKSAAARWHWPLRIGVLPRDSGLRHDIEDESRRHQRQWPQQLLDFVETGSGNGRCDLLLLPHTLRSAASRILELASPPEAACVVVVGPAGAAPSDTLRLLRVIDDEVRTNALALVDLEPRSVAAWFVELLRYISHDEPFDLALAHSFAKRPENPFHVLLAEHDWIESTRLSSMMRSLQESFARPELKDETLEIDADLSASLNAAPGHRRLADLSFHPEHWLSEGGGATTLVHLTRAAAPALRRNPPSPPQRLLQAQVLALPGPGSSSQGPLAAFVAGARHRIDVRVGIPEAEWIASSEAFPEDRLPPSEAGHRLTVILTEPVLAPQPQVGHIFLPPTGSSSVCSFYVKTTSGPARVQARITVLYRNRVLQTSTLDGPVLPPARGSAERGAISLLPEVVVSAGLSDLDRQGSYGAALVLNHTPAGMPQVLKVVDDHAELISTGNLSPNVQAIEDELGRCDWGSREFCNMGAPGTLNLLLFLARHGSLLYRGVVKQQFIDHRLAAATRIQLIAAKPGVRLPVEYFYDLPSPRADAALCPSASKALAKGECSPACAARKDPNGYVCPLAFWGISRVLEWHAYRPQAARELGNYDYALQQEKIAQRGQLRPLSHAVLGASARADAEVKDSVRKLASAVEKAASLAQVQTWAAWRQEISRHSPSLLVLIPHTEVERQGNLPQLEIGKGQWLPLDQLDESYVHGKDVQPIVLLLGCETAQQHVTFEDFISNFAASGAAIVVASSTLVLGRQATVLAAELVAVLKKLTGKKSSTFGDVMLAVRRNMLRKGYPMVLSVSSYGDADWRL